MNNKNIKWYKLPESTLLNLLKTSYTYSGLNDEEVKERQFLNGKNELPKLKSPSVFKIIFAQLINPLIYILIIASIISLILGDKKDAIFIFIVILINTIIGTLQEWKAEKSSEALQQLIKICVKVKRNDETKLLNSIELVTGDIVILEAGIKVPADIRILESNKLASDESLLTGESIALHKKVTTYKEDMPVNEQENMLFAGTVITSGKGIGVVVAIGLDTEIGKIAKTLTTVEKQKAPLIIRIEQFSTQISLIILFSCVFISIIELSRGMSLTEVFFIAVALAVSSIPEGLPAALTVVLSVGMSKMVKKNVIIRKLSAVEGLGSCTVIASDKTGTLTVNKQTVREIYMADGNIFNVSGEGYSGSGEITADESNTVNSNLEDLIITAVISNEAYLNYKQNKWKYHGDAVDIALLSLAYKYGLSPVKINEDITVLNEIPYESEKRFSAKFYKKNNTTTTKIAIKGAVESILPYCQTITQDNELVAIDKTIIEKQALYLAEQGFKTIAVAEGYFDEKQWNEFHVHQLNLSASSLYKDKDNVGNINSLNFLGLIGLIDPLRPEAKTAIEKCHEAGVKVLMITGDHPATALTIGKELGIATCGNDIAKGSDLAEKFTSNPEEYIELVNNTCIFARVTPIQKLHIVEALNKLGHFTAVTGDGVNDAPALKIANISVAMGSGTDIAKEVSSIIIIDDNFASVVSGIEEGRVAYDNIRKVVYLLVATGVAEIILFLLAIIFNMSLPLIAVQLLWLNLVTNGLQGVALAFEKGEKETMTRPPRPPKESLFNPLMIQEVLVSSLHMGVFAFVLWFILISQGISESYARNIILMLMVFFENFQVFNCRSEYRSVLNIPLKNNWLVILSVILAQAIHIISLHIPVMQEILSVEPIKMNEWLYLLGLALSLLGSMELFKYFKNRKLKKK